MEDLSLEPELKSLINTLSAISEHASKRSEFRVSLTRLKEAIFWLQEGLDLYYEEGPEK